MRRRRVGFGRSQLRAGFSALGGVGPGPERGGVRRRRTGFGRVRGAGDRKSKGMRPVSEVRGAWRLRGAVAATVARVGPGRVAGERAEGSRGKAQDEEVCWRRQRGREKRTELEPERPWSTGARLEETGITRRSLEKLRD